MTQINQTSSSAEGLPVNQLNCYCIEDLKLKISSHLLIHLELNISR